MSAILVRYLELPHFIAVFWHFLGAGLGWTQVDKSLNDRGNIFGSVQKLSPWQDP